MDANHEKSSFVALLDKCLSWYELDAIFKNDVLKH
jgi:hypothetical protein